MIGLWVRSLDGNGVPIVLTAADPPRPGGITGHLSDSATTNYSFDSRLGYLATDAGNSGYYIAKSAYYDSGVTPHEQIQAALPSTIEIAIVLIDSQTANRVTAIPSYTPYNMSPTLPTGANAAVAPYTSNSPNDFWNDINTFLTNLQSSQPLVAKGAHVYSIRVPLVNGG